MDANLESLPYYCIREQMENLKEERRLTLRVRWSPVEAVANPCHCETYEEAMFCAEKVIEIKLLSTRDPNQFDSRCSSTHERSRQPDQR